MTRRGTLQYKTISGSAAEKSARINIDGNLSSRTEGSPAQQNLSRAERNSPVKDKPYKVKEKGPSPADIAELAELERIIHSLKKENLHLKAENKVLLRDLEGSTTEALHQKEIIHSLKKQMEALLGLAKELEDRSVFSASEIKQLCLSEIHEATVALDAGVSPQEIKESLDRFAQDLVEIS